MLAGTAATVIFGMWGGPTYAGIALALTLAYLVAGAGSRRGSSDDRAGGLIHLVCAAVPVASIILLYHPITEAWWLGDDPAILRHILEYPLIRNLYAPDVWRSYSAANLTPLLILSLGLDHTLFGLDPTDFYRHQLLSLIGIALAGYAVLARFLSPIAAAAAMTILVTSLPVATLAQQLMTRHYIEGLLLSLLASLLYLAALSRKRYWLSLAAALCYALAAAAKEIYVPLFLVLPFIAAGTPWRRRLRYIVPMVGTAAAYTLWRVFMLFPGNALGGYGSLHDSAPLGLGAALGRAASALGWNSGFALGFVGAVCALGVVAVLAAHRRSLGAFVVGTAVTVAPLVPVAALLDSRMLLLPAGLLVLLGIGGISWLARGPAGSGRGWPLLLILIWIGLNLWSLERSELWGQREWIERYRAEGRWVLEADPRLTLLEPIGPFWYYSGLAWIRENRFGRGTAPSVCFDACLCDSSELAHTRGYRDGDLIPVAARTDCPPVSGQDVSLDAEYDPHRGVFRWSMEPAQAGDWFFLLEPGAARIPVPRSGSTPMYRPGVLRARAMHEAPSGERSLSQPFCVMPEGLVADCP